MEIVESFKNAECAKLNWLDKLFEDYPRFYDAWDIDLELKDVNVDKAFVVKPSKARRFIALLFVCFGLFAWGSIFLLVAQKILWPISIGFLILVTAWIGLVLWIFFFNPKLSYKITIDKDKIVLGKRTFEWNAVSYYLLMEKGSGRSLIETLVLFVDDKEVYKYNLGNLNTSGQELLKRISSFSKKCTR
jgi:hypothetical protein